MKNLSIAIMDVVPVLFLCCTCVVPVLAPVLHRPGDNLKTDNKMRKLENFHLLVMLIALIAVGQMTQTVYVPVITDIALDFGELRAPYKV